MIPTVLANYYSNSSFHMNLGSLIVPLDFFQNTSSRRESLGGNWNAYFYRVDTFCVIQPNSAKALEKKIPFPSCTVKNWNTWKFKRLFLAPNVTEMDGIYNNLPQRMTEQCQWLLKQVPVHKAGQCLKPKSLQ